MNKIVNLRFWNFKPVSRNIHFICCGIFPDIMVVYFHLKRVLLSLTFIVDISRFYNVLNHHRGSTSFYFNRNIIEGSREIVMYIVMFFNFWSFFWKYTFLRLQRFISTSTYPSTQFYECLFASNKIHVLIKHIFVLATDAMVTEKLSFSYFHGNQC